MESKNLLMFALLLSLMGLSLAASTGDISNALTQLCGFFNTILPMGIMVVIVLAGIVFAVGQTMGAETRARANVWATNLIIGAIIGAVVYVLAPWFIGVIMNTTAVCP